MDMMVILRLISDHLSPFSTLSIPLLLLQGHNLRDLALGESGISIHYKEKLNRTERPIFALYSF